MAVPQDGRTIASARGKMHLGTGKDAPWIACDACGLRAGAYTFGSGAAAIGARWEVLPKTAASYGGARGQREAAPRCVAVLSERATE